MLPLVAAGSTGSFAFRPPALLFLASQMDGEYDKNEVATKVLTRRQLVDTLHDIFQRLCDIAGESGGGWYPATLTREPGRRAGEEPVCETWTGSTVPCG